MRHAPLCCIVAVALISCSKAPYQDAYLNRPALVFEPQSHDFGYLAYGSTPPTFEFALRNIGKHPSGTFDVIVSQEGTHFGIDASTCTGSLAPGESCRVTVRFSDVETIDYFQAKVIAHNDVFDATAGLAATVREAARFGSSDTRIDFPNTAPGKRSVPVSVRICNRGQSPSGAIATAITGDGAPNFELLSGGCAGTTLDGDACCNVAVDFAPQVSGDFSAALTLTADPGGALSLALTGRTGYRLTVTLSNEAHGPGRVISTPAGIDCPGSCSATFDKWPVGLVASATNGSGVVFRGFDEYACTGSVSGACQVWSSGEDMTVEARFADIAHNLVFVSSESFPPTLGGTAPYDAACNRLATAAGINNAAGNAFVAWMSDANSTAVSRLGTALGFERVDGVPFALDVTGLLANRVLNPLRADEHGYSDPYGVSDGRIWTGTRADGSVGDTCSNWTAGGGTATAGDIDGGPGAWTEGWIASCSSRLPIACMMTTLQQPLTPSSTSGKRIFMSNTGLPIGGGTAAADQLCASSKPAGASGARALLTTSRSLAKANLSEWTTYVRPDGQLVGSGEALISGARLVSGIWQTGDGTYVNGALATADYPTSMPFIWTGSMSPDESGADYQLCKDLSDATQIPEPTIGWFGTAQEKLWWGSHFSGARCQHAYRVYCVEY